MVSATKLCGLHERPRRAPSFVAERAPLPDESIHVFVCAAIRLYREGLARVLSATQGLQVVGTAATSAEAARLLPGLSVDVLLVDLPAADSFLALPRMVRPRPTQGCLRSRYPRSSTRCPIRAEAGIEGYVTRDASLTDLLHAIVGLHRGELICSPNMAAALLRHIGRLAAGRSGTGNRDAYSPSTSDRCASRRWPLQQGDRSLPFHRTDNGEEPRPRSPREVRSGTARRSCEGAIGRY